MVRIRSQKNFNMVLLATVLVVIVVITAYAFTRQISVDLPPYLNRCLPLNGSYVYRSIPVLAINITGVPQQIPSNIGVDGNCFRPIFTLAPTGAIHIVTDVNRDYTLGDFFLIWGNTYGVSFSIFNRFQIFDYKTNQNHNLTMFINHRGQISPDTSFENYVLPRDANDTNIFLIGIDYT